MNTSLVFNFIKRVFLIPVIVTLVGVVVLCSFIPDIIQASNNAVDTTISTVNISDYKLTDFKNFKELEKGYYVGSVSVKSVNINCAVVYNSDTEENTVNMIKGSKEPWKSGGVVIKGLNKKASFNSLHNVCVGDEIEFDIYKNSSYNYKISNIVYGVEEGELSEYITKNTLVLCLPYTNFYNSNEECFYTLYIANVINGGDVVG